MAIANKNPTTLALGTARIERDPESGAIVRVLNEDGSHDGRRREWNGRVLRDELDKREDEIVELGQHDLPAMDVRAFGGGGEGVVPDLVLQAATGGVKKRPRKQSRREEEWVGKLVEKYGDDVGKMARDRRLNPMQQSEGDIGRRIRMWREGRRKT